MDAIYWAAGGGLAWWLVKKHKAAQLANPPAAGTFLGNGGGGNAHYADGMGHIVRPSVPGETNRRDPAVGMLLALMPTPTTWVAWTRGSDDRWYHIPGLTWEIEKVPDPAVSGIGTLGWDGKPDGIVPP